MFTKKTLYALKALTLLAQRSDRSLVATCQLADRGNIPRKFLQTILRDLQRHGILFAQRGPSGGYALRRDAAEIPLARVVRALDGPLSSAPCVNNHDASPCLGCRPAHACGVRLIMKELCDATAHVLETTTLADLVRREEIAATQDVERRAYSI